MKNKIKRLKGGKYKLQIEEDLRAVLVHALAAVIHFEGEDMEDYLFALLAETLEEIRSREVPRLMRSQLLALVRNTRDYIDEPTQLYIMGLLPD
ncbi:MAG: hypothetical protein ACOYOO_10225 [Saprospiraceae bacterium]|jgi:hypothetical protein